MKGTTLQQLKKPIVKSSIIPPLARTRTREQSTTTSHLFTSNYSERARFTNPIPYVLSSRLVILDPPQKKIRTLSLFFHSLSPYLPIYL